MPKLILVKHSVPEIDPTLPARLWHLSEVGRLRCDTLADRLADYSPDAVVSSIEPKAVETAQIIAHRLGLPLETREELHEHERDGVGFLSSEQFEASVARFFENPRKLVFGEETAEQAYLRFAEEVSGVIEVYPDENIVVVAHGTVITLFVAYATGLEPLSFWKRLGLPSFVVLSLPKLNLEGVIENVGG
jgi:broad specificity phosphatase PhoE